MLVLIDDDNSTFLETKKTNQPSVPNYFSIKVAFSNSSKSLDLVRS